MLGAIIGDVVGSRLERGGKKDYDFELFTAESRFTDDTVCTLAIADALLSGGIMDYKTSLLMWGRRYPDAGYGKGFKAWLASADPQPYGSNGNGSAMRVSPVGWWEATGLIFGRPCSSLLSAVERSAAPTHNSAEGILGAQVVAYAMALAKYPSFSKADIAGHLKENFPSYYIAESVEAIRPSYKFDATCSGSVPQAIRCFLDSTDFESAIRLAVSLGGDTDTQASIAGAIAHAYYRVIPERMLVETLARLPQPIVDLIIRFHAKMDIPFNEYRSSLCKS